jgi:hypothetical protein
MASTGKAERMPVPEQRGVGDPERDKREGAARISPIARIFGSCINRSGGGHSGLTAPLLDADRSGPEGGDL